MVVEIESINNLLVPVTTMGLQYFGPEKAFAVLSVCTCIFGACGSVSVYLQHCDL